MIYLLLFLAIWVGVFRYDFCSKKSYNRETYYKYVLFFFIIMSGLSYKVGSDINAYMAEFSIINYEDLLEVNFFSLSNRQPMWLLFENVCKTVINNFAFMKIVISIFVNVTLFRFFKDNSSYCFSAVLVYFFMMSFDVNFNILRQSISMSFFLIAYSCLTKRKIFLAYTAIIMAIMFHNSAVVLLMIPVFSSINLYKHPRIIWSIAIILSLVVVFFVSYSEILQGISMVMKSDELVSFAGIYDDNEYGASAIKFASVLFYVVLDTIIYCYLVKFKCSNSLIWMFLFYIIFFLISYSIPIFGRIKLYFTPFYIVAVVNLIYRYTKSIRSTNNRGIVTIALLTMFMFPSIKYFFVKNPRYNDMQLIQYYPYHSIIDKGIEQKREILFPANY